LFLKKAKAKQNIPTSPTKKLYLPPLKQKQKSAKARQQIAQFQQSQTKKVKARTQQDTPPFRHRPNKKENPESRTPTKSCAKTQRQLVAGELEIFARTERRIINARTQFNEGNARGGHEGGCAKICWQNHGGLGWKKFKIFLGNQTTTAPQRLGKF
jgi:hypothetical protein